MSQSTEFGYVHSITFSVQPVKREGETKHIDLASLRLKIDRARYAGLDDAGKAEFDNSKSYWIDARMWGNAVAYLKGVVDKGASVMMSGIYINESWIDKETKEDRSKLVFVADHIALLPRSIESVVLKSKPVESD